MRTVEEALRALSRLTNYERTRADGPRDFNLSRPARLLERLGAPHRRLGGRVVQVAGTKGKGSTARFVDGIFRAAGLRTGRFLSPHLESVRERIAVNGVLIEEAEFAAHVERVLDTVDGETTFFEALLAAACLHFAEHKTDAAVLEVGLGGRLDATTAVPATHTIITEISYDHTEILGTSLEEIAAEKAGTIRPGVPVWSGVDPRSAAGGVIERIARERDAPFHHVAAPEAVHADALGLSFDDYRLPVFGRHQAHNAVLAIAAAGRPRAVTARGLAGTTQPGCCELRGRILLDGAHTLSSIQATLRAVADHFPGSRPELVLALAQDKDLDGIAAALAPVVAGVTCTRVDERRGRTADALALHPAWEGRAVAVEDARAALQRARDAAGPKGLVLVTGSLYLAGALRSQV
ncbi:MAG: bifunctional folylpolyglutamate synthase/dihydrofolate synthase [Planctomycetota bacterium]|jgi:dihydrofolate synthase/folylpolyglutamate synthase